MQQLAAQLAVTLQAIDLRVAQAYLSPYVRLELLGGELAGNLDVQVAHGEQLALQVRGQASVQGLHTRDTLRHRDLLKWQALRLDGLDYRHGEQLHIEGIELEQPYAVLLRCSWLRHEKRPWTAVLLYGHEPGNMTKLHLTIDRVTWMGPKEEGEETQ